MNGNNGILKRALRRTWVRVFAIVSVVFLFVKIFTQYIPSQYFWYTILCIMILFLTSFSISLYAETKRVRGSDQEPWPRNELVDKESLSYVDVAYAIDELVADIRGFAPSVTPDVIIGIDRGGAIVGGMIAKYLECPLTTISSSDDWTISDTMSSLDDGVKDPTQRTDKYQRIEKILLVDDACRSGNTLRKAYDILNEKCDFNLKKVTILNEKRVHHKQITPDFFVYKTKQSNVLMPWDKEK